MAFSDQFFPLRHPKFVLLIDDDQAQFFLREGRFNQSVGADHKGWQWRVERGECERGIVPISAGGW